ncbi:response regulator [Chitinophagaceae bacterium MMS25-I14]
MSISVFIADDHPIVLYGLEQLIRNIDPGIELAGCFGSGTKLLHELQHRHPDVLLLDINMPDIDGFVLTRQISGHYPATKIIALTNSEDIESVRYIISQGAHGYVLKTSDHKVILQAIRTAYQGKQFIDPALHERLMYYSLEEENTGSLPVKLTRREKEILELIASNYTSQEIADKIFVSKRTVDNHRFNLLTKLDVKNAPALIKKAMELNLLN